MAITLKEENILDQWSTVLEQANGKGQVVINQIQSYLEASRIPGECRWKMEEIQSSAWLSRVKRESLIVTIDQFKDYRQYITVRDYGTHLDVSRFMTVEPGFFKKTISNQLSGSVEALSAPKNILVEQDLRAWMTIVHRAVVHAVEIVMAELGQDTSNVKRESKGYLSVW